MKYSFVEFLAAVEGRDFDIIEDSWMRWAERFLSGYDKIWPSARHYGDCTKHSSPCHICMLHAMMNEYYEYFFNEDKWRLENGH